MDVSTRTALTRAFAAVGDRLIPQRHQERFVDLNALAKRLGVRDILYTATRMHGYTDWTERGAVIRLSIAKTEGRRRTTLAHECGHLLLNPLLEPHTLEVSRTIADMLKEQSERMLGDDAAVIRRANAELGIEKMCNFFAFELLLPHARAEKAHVSDAAALLQFASEHHVSASFLVHQLNAAGGDLRLARLTRISSTSWMVIDAAGKTWPWRTASLLNEKSSARLEALHAQPEAHTAIPLNITDASPNSRWVASVLRRPKSAFALTVREVTTHEGLNATPARSFT